MECVFSMTKENKEHSMQALRIKLIFFLCVFFCMLRITSTMPIDFNFQSQHKHTSYYRDYCRWSTWFHIEFSTFLFSWATAPCLQLSDLHFFYLVFTMNVKRRVKKNEKKKEPMSASPKCLFNAYIHTYKKRNWYWWLCKENPINWKCTYRTRAMRILKTKKGRLLNLNHNLFVLKIRQNAKMETQACNGKGNSIRSHHIQHIRCLAKRENRNG